MKGLKLYTDGRIETYELPKARENYISLQKSIDCDCIDIVHAVNLKEPYCLVVDDEALLKERPTINLVASYLYGALEHGQPICGDVLIMKDEWMPDGIDTVGLDEADFEELNGFLFDAETRNGVVQTYAKISAILRGE